MFSIVTRPLVLHVEIPSDELLIIEEKINSDFVNQTIQEPSNSINNFFMFLWIAGVVVMVVVYLYNYMKFIKERDWLLIEKSHYHLYLSKSSRVPYSVGLIQKNIILPESYVLLNESELKMIIEHERKHFELYHHQILAIMHLIKIIYWFNPIVYLVFNHLKDQMEYCVDEYVNDDQTSCYKKAYCECLLKLSENHQVRQLSFANKRSKVYKRIQLILEGSHMKTKNKIFIIMMSVLLTACGSVEIATTVKQNLSKEEVINETDFEKAKTWLVNEASKYKVEVETTEACYHPRGVYRNEEGRFEIWSMPHGSMYFEVRMMNDDNQTIVYFPLDSDLMKNVQEKLLKLNFNEEK